LLSSCIFVVMLYANYYKTLLLLSGRAKIMPVFIAGDPATMLTVCDAVLHALCYLDDLYSSFWHSYLYSPMKFLITCPTLMQHPFVWLPIMMSNLPPLFYWQNGWVQKGCSCLSSLLDVNRGGWFWLSVSSLHCHVCYSNFHLFSIFLCNQLFNFNNSWSVCLKEN
jgi:hypothetical protein